MPVTITKTAKPAVATVTKHTADGATTETQEVVGWADSQKPLANVAVSMGLTKATAPYENVKFQVFLSVPCDNTPTALEENFQFAKGWVESKVDLINDEMNEQMK